MTTRYKILCVVGARPNFMKIAPVMDALQQSESLSPYLVHTGQHYDEAMKQAFFLQMGIPEPRVHFVGKVMMGTLMSKLKEKVPVSQTLSKAGCGMERQPCAA